MMPQANASSPKFKPEQVSFVIPVRDDEARLRMCLSSIAALDRNGISAEIIVADNGSTDKSCEVAAQGGARVMHLANLPVAKARNRAAALALGNLIAFVDADHVLDPGWLKAGIDAIMETNAAAVGAPCLAPENSTWVQRAYDRFRVRPPARTETDWLGSGNLMIRRDVFLALHGFDERLETCEDVDICQRLRRTGWRLIAEPGMRNVHLGDPATLRALFLGELWRGRDNLRVTLRGPLTLRSLASLMISLASLLFLITTLIALAMLSAWRGSWLIIAGALVGFACISFCRAVRMTRLQQIESFGENLVVASVYELARALALVLRASHRTRRRGR